MERFFTDDEEWTRDAHDLHFRLKMDAEAIVRDYPEHNLRELLYIMQSAVTDAVHTAIIRRRLSPPCPKNSEVESSQVEP